MKLIWPVEFHHAIQEPLLPQASNLMTHMVVAVRIGIINTGFLTGATLIRSIVVLLHFARGS